MKKRYVLLTAATVLFVIVNMLLIGIDKQGKVSRLAYIKDWAAASVKHLHETYETEGIVRYREAFHIYFDDSVGNFNEFLVKEGETVKAGEPLFSYFARDYTETKMMLDQKADVLEQEMAAIDTAIDKAMRDQSQSQRHLGVEANSALSHEMSEYGTPETVHTETDQGLIESLLQDAIEDAQTEQAEALLRQYVIDQEKEHAQKEAQAEGIRKQLSALAANGDTIIVESPYAGKVTEVSSQLADPLITISDPEELVIAGEMTEQERMHTKEDMDAIAVMQESGKRVDAVLRHVSEEPTDLKLDSQSIYPFTAGFKEPEEAADLLPGYHATLEIITKTAQQATAVPDRAIYRGAVWQINGNGKLIRHDAQTGISEKDFTQINEVVEPGDLVALSPKSNFRDRAEFITPLKLKELSWKDLQADKRSNFKYVITGILSR